MKKSNVILYAILAVVSIFLLWLWYFLGLNRVDQPLDLILSIIWWVVIVVSIVVIVRVEKARKERVRTFYVSDDIVFNSELGSKPYEGPVELVNVMEEMLNDLKYNFHKEDLPDKDAFPVKFIVRTFDFDMDDNKNEEQKQTMSSQDGEKWTGEVVNAETSRATEFESKEDMFKIINGMRIYNVGSAPTQSTGVGTASFGTTAPQA